MEGNRQKNCTMHIISNIWGRGTGKINWGLGEWRVKGVDGEVIGVVAVHGPSLLNMNTHPSHFFFFGPHMVIGHSHQTGFLEKLQELLIPCLHIQGGRTVLWCMASAMPNKTSLGHIKASSLVAPRLQTWVRAFVCACYFFTFSVPLLSAYADG